MLSTPEEWTQLLKTFAEAAGDEHWPGGPGASEADLLKVECRLKVTLPPSYRAFLSASNGWRNASREVPVLRPVGKIRWFKKEHPEWVQAYVDPMLGSQPLLPAEKDYFNYEAEDSVQFDTRHLTQALCISDVGDDAVLLLNPMVVWPDGEWEAWLFANWLPGATRFRSFADWMQRELASRRDEQFAHPKVSDELPTVYLDGPAKLNRRVRPKEKIFTFEQIVKLLASRTRSKRIKAVRQLGRIDGAAAITTLLGLLVNDYDYHVRCEAAAILGRIRAEEAIGALIAISAEVSHVTSSAVEALGYFQDEASAQRLLELVEADNSWAGVAAYALARRNDPRCVPALVQKLVSKEPRDQHTGNIAGRYMAQFERAGLVALEPLVDHEDVEIRRRALSGIFDVACLGKSKEIKMQARQLLERRLEKESDEVERRNLEVCIAVACNRKPPAEANPFKPV